MGYRKFLEDVQKHCEWKEERNIPTFSMDELFCEVRDKWINEKKYEELINFILENWDSGNCNDFIKPFSKYLADNKQIVFFKKLWKGVIRLQLEVFWENVDYMNVDYPNTEIDFINKIDLSDFDEFSG